MIMKTGENGNTKCELRPWVRMICQKKDEWMSAK